MPGAPARFACDSRKSPKTDPISYLPNQREEAASSFTFESRKCRAEGPGSSAWVLRLATALGIVGRRCERPRLRRLFKELPERSTFLRGVPAQLSDSKECLSSQSIKSLWPSPSAGRLGKELLKKAVSDRCSRSARRDSRQILHPPITTARRRPLVGWREGFGAAPRLGTFRRLGGRTRLRKDLSAACTISFLCVRRQRGIPINLALAKRER